MSDDPSILVVNDQLVVPLSEIEFSYVRSSGPGGQNVNKVNSRAQLSWSLRETATLPEEVLTRFRQAHRGRITKEDVVRLDSQRYRDQDKNRQDCLNRLREMIVEVLEPPKRRRKTRVPRRVREQRLRHKRQRSQLKRLRRPPHSDE